MKKLLFLFCSALLVPLFFLSCSDVSSSSLSFTLPSSLARNVTDGQSAETVYELKIELDGDIRQEHSYNFSLTDLQKGASYTIDGLQTGASLSVTASIYSAANIQLYGTKTPAQVTLQAGQNEASVVLTRCSGDVDFSIATFEISATYTVTGTTQYTIRNSTDTPEIQFMDTDVDFIVETGYIGELSYTWLFNGNEVSTESKYTTNLTENDYVLLNEKNTVTCLIAAGGAEKTVELTFYANELKVDSSTDAQTEE